MKWCTSHLIEVAFQAQRWKCADSTIADMPIEEQAEYADIVTRYVCNHDEEIVISLAQEILGSDWSSSTVGSCGVGNLAHVILTIETYPTQVELGKKLRLILAQVINKKG